MLELFSAETTIVVGLDLTDNEENILHTATSLAQKTGSKLILVHAAQPFRSYTLAGEGFALPYEEFEKETYDSDIKVAELKLNAIRDRIPPEIVVETEVFRDYPENALDAVSTEARASLIICGIHSEKDDSIFSGMSTAFSLMSQAQVPVMIIPADSQVDFMSQKHTVLVADNLRNEGLFALRAALGLCKSISYRHLVHLHVKPTSYKEINSTVDKIRIAMIEGRIPNDPDFNAHIYVERIKADMKENMHKRLIDADSDFAQGLHYTPRVRFGDPASEVHRLVSESRADILVFGKHHFFRPKGLVIGKIPYSSMIERRVATIVVPDKEAP